MSVTRNLDVVCIVYFQHTITTNTCAVEFLDSYLDVFVLPWSKKASVCFHRPHLNLAIPLKGTVGNLTCLKMHLITSVQCTYIVHHIISCRTFPYQTVSMFFYFTSNCVMVMKVFTCMEKPIWVKENVEEAGEETFLTISKKASCKSNLQHKYYVLFVCVGIFHVGWFLFQNISVTSPWS